MIAAALPGYPSLVALGVANLVGLSVAGPAYEQGFASWWCIWTALSSIFIMVRRRQHLSYGDRLHRHPRESLYERDAEPDAVAID